MKGGVKLKVILFNNKGWHFCCLLLFILACNARNTGDDKQVTLYTDSIKNASVKSRAMMLLDSLKRKIHTGDLVTRTGNDFTSECLKKINVRDKTYSHCGIAIVENESIFVYHALGGEFNPDQQLRRDPLLVFADPATNRGTGLFRFQLTVTESSILESDVHKLYQAGLPFDMQFDLRTDERMYCAEFVYKALLWSTNARLRFNISKIKDKDFVGVDDLFLHPECKKIESILYR